MNDHGTLRWQPGDGTGLHFEARFASGLTTRFDSGDGATAPNPVLHLIASLAACEAMDVISILRKKRLDVTAYEVAMRGQRSEAHPRRFTAIEFVHRVTGRGVPAAAVEEAVRLSEEKYCSVRHTLDPAMPVTWRVEVLEA
jgi:putative redox protein